MPFGDPSASPQSDTVIAHWVRSYNGTQRVGQPPSPATIAA